jgi:hypothetical protein
MVPGVSEFKKFIENRKFRAPSIGISTKPSQSLMSHSASKDFREMVIGVSEFKKFIEGRWEGRSGPLKASRILVTREPSERWRLGFQSPTSSSKVNPNADQALSKPPHYLCLERRQRDGDWGLKIPQVCPRWKSMAPSIEISDEIPRKNGTRSDSPAKIQWSVGCMTRRRWGRCISNRG